jgi:hypothetical protein
LVGCVVYGSSFEPRGAPTHQTRFKYYLGKTGSFGLSMYVIPKGIISDLELKGTPDGFSAD